MRQSGSRANQPVRGSPVSHPRPPPHSLSRSAAQPCAAQPPAITRSQTQAPTRGRGGPARSPVRGRSPARPSRRPAQPAQAARAGQSATTLIHACHLYICLIRSAQQSSQHPAAPSTGCCQRVHGRAAEQPALSIAGPAASSVTNRAGPSSRDELAVLAARAERMLSTSEAHVASSTTSLSQLASYSCS